MAYKRDDNGGQAAASVAPSRGSTSAGSSGSAAKATYGKGSPKPSARSSGGGSRDSSAHAAASADRAAAAGRGKVATFTPTRKSSTPWALDWADGGHGSSRQNSANAGTYRGAVNSPTAGQQGYGASGGMEGLQEGRDARRSPAEREQSVEDSHLQASILQLARGAGGKKIKGDGTAFGYANELIQMWNEGKDVAPVVKDGVVSWVNGVDRTGTRVFYDYDEKGNKVKTKDKELQNANDDAMWTDIEGWLKYANSGSQTRADNIKQSGPIAEYMRAIENGLIDNYDVTKESGETLSLYDYLGELFDLRDQLDEVADVNEASTAARYFSQQYDDIFTRLQSGADVDYNKIGDDAVSLAGYAKRFAGDEQLSSFFSGLSDEYYRLYNRESIKELEAQNQELETALAQAKSDGLAASQGVTWLDSADVIASDEDRRIAEEKAEAANAATREIYDSQMAVQAQIAQLNDEYRNRFMTPEVEAAMQRLSIPELGKAYPDAHGKADAEQLRREDQQLVDDWNSGMGFAQQYYNWQDRLAGVSKSFAARTAGSVANIAALATDAVTYDNDQLREAQQARDMAARAYLTDATPENKAALDEAEAALSQAQNDLATGQTERTGAAVKLEDIADTLDENALAEIAKAKEGASKWGQFGLDLLSTGMDMGFDALTGGGLYTMFARVAGSGIGEARRAGASSEEQLFYGLSKGAIEIATEKLTDGLGAIYGKGISSDVVEKAISRLSSSEAGANFLRLLAGVIGEGGEEVMSDLLDPFTKWVIDEGARDNRTYDVDLSEMLYDFLLGGAMGFLGQGGEVVRGEYAAKNAEIREGDAAILEKAENAEATGQQLSKGELRDLEAAQAREAQQGIKGGLVIGPNGGLVIAPGTRAAAKGDNRHDTAVSTLAEGFEGAGYVNSTDADADYTTATTGAEGPRTDAEADQQSYAQEIEAEAERQAEADEARKAEEAQEAPQETGRTPGKVKQSQSAFEQDVATKGERANTDVAMGETEFLSRTNEARSRTADALTDTQEKADAQVQRLLQEDYVWNDDDVVISQKLMFDMVKAIRDYQLKKNSKMKPEAFKRMTDQYNQLMTKHQQKLSTAGQELQANYMFSTGDKIVMRAAQTFLGFTKDGRFAGASVNAKNAKIYAGIEEASKRIQKAVDAEDVQSLAKICKDISNIRNVKKMFGPLGGFADAMETRVLDKIAKGENAAKNLENLAYGNLNAVCDDVQPYKALNAAKTIRVMNMLSNTATIVNNLANNFAQGAVNRSRVNQAFNSLAAKPFEALTGQEVLSKTARGKEARQAVRNAKMEALETATLMQMYGITEENGRLELNDRGMFNPNINVFEQTMSLYKFLTGMGVEATDKMQAAGILKSMELGIDADIKARKIEAHTKEQRMQEARHEVNRLLYKDDNSTTALVQHVRDYLNKFHVGNDRVGTIGLGDITMAFAKIPANVVRARLAMTPEGALLQVAQYAKGVNKAKRMHAEVLAKGIVESYREQIDAANTALQSAYEMEHGPAKDAAIRKAQGELSRLNSKMWSEAQDACRGSVYRNLSTIAGNYNENMMFNEAVERAGYMNAKEMSQFEAAQLSRKIGRAATSAGMMALGSVLRALGALRDFDQEPDDELRKMNSDKGYRGLMMNLSAIGRKNHEWKDGDLIIDGEFLEVIAMPLTIGATAAEAAATAQDAKTWSWLKSMAGNGIAKTFEAVGDIPGMADAINMYESLTSAYTTDYDEKVSRLGAGLLQYAANTVPSFFVPNSISQATAGFDNKVRDVYAADTPWGQAKNIFMNKIPGLRNKVPVSVDVWGNDRTYGEGLWGAVNKMLLPGDVQVYRKNKYEAEIERMVKAGYGNATPKTTVNSSFEVGDEKYTMTAQEKLDFKAARNSQQRELFEAFIDSDYYKNLSDAERMKVFQSLKTSAERDAKQDMLDGRQLNVQITRDKWETELPDVNDQIQFLAAKQMANNVLDRDAEDMDYAAVDKYLTGTYKALDKTQRELLDSSFSRLDDMYEAKSSYGIGSEMFNTGYDIYKDYMSDEGRARVSGGYKDWEGSQMYTDIAKATGASEKQMDFFEKKFVLYNNNAVTPEKYNAFVDAGWNRETAQSMVKAVADLTPTNGRKNVSYKQRLTAIATTSGLTEAQRWEAFFEYCPSSYTSVIRSMNRYRSNGFSYAKALKAAKKWDD